MSIIQEFKEFAVKGDVINLAVAVMIGGAFGKIVSSLVDDVIMPAIGIILGKIDLTSLNLSIGEANLAYGKFAQNLIEFFIIAFTVFLMLKFINKLKSQVEKAKKTKTIK